MKEVIRLGPFALERPIARGGMAEVWRGVHASEQVPVAVKVLTGARAREEAFVRALKNEIHAVARLDHPGIIVLYDRGEVTEEASNKSGGRLVPGSPWFAMEMCSHGALSPRRFPLPWRTTRMLLLSLLDALAHAHARGVVHRDLKPGNVLLCAPEDPRPGLKLSDFGIAQPLSGYDQYLGSGGAGAGSDAHSGTPRYMAPEQFNGKARELGPWTDLYALGCIAFQLATGNPPFSGDPLRLAVAHCHDPVPALTPKYETARLPGTEFPVGFEAWVLRLLEKDPHDRFRVAADAAWALMQLTSDDDDPTVSLDWESALRSLKPRPMFPDDDSAQSSQPSDGSGDDTAAHTIGPPRGEPGTEHPSMDYTPAPPPGIEESTTGEVKLPSGADPSARTGREDQPTAVGRMRSPVSHVTSPPLTAGHPHPGAAGVMPGNGPETAPTGHRAHAPPPRKSSSPPAGPVIPDDDPFAVLLGSEDDDKRGGDDDPATDPRTWAPQAPWTELLAMAEEQQAQQAKENHPTIAGPFHDELRSTDSGAVPRRVRAPAVPPPLPRTWRRPEEPLLPLPPARRLLGAGLGLYGLRQPPVVDRAEERDQLWRALVHAHAGGSGLQPANPAGGEDVVVVVRGPAGIGRSRLCSWFGERGAEVGACITLSAGHSPDGSPHDGISGALLRHARAIGLKARDSDGDGLHEQLRHAFADFDVDDRAALAAALAPHSPLPPRERHVVLRRALTSLTRERPVVVVFDDAQWGDDVIAFARSIVDEPRAAASTALPGRAPPPRRHGLVIVCAVGDEALAERATTAAAVDALCALPGVVTLVLPPLPAADQRRLVEELLGLEPRLADLVATRSAGNPRFAVELVGDFVERGVLELVPAGFALRRGEPAVLPDDLHAVWSKRLQHLLAPLPPEAGLCLELGAVLGKDGDEVEWLALCAAAGIKEPRAVVEAVTDALERARYVVLDHGTWRFAHAMLRESMARLAHEAGRLVEHHRLIARVLAPAKNAHGTNEAATANQERRARHLLAAGDLDAALPLLLASAASALSMAGSTRSVSLIDEAFAALDRHDIGQEDPRRLLAIALRARALADAGRYAESGMWARLIKDDAPVRVRVEAHRALALAALRQGNLDDTIARYERLLAIALTLPDHAADADDDDDPYGKEAAVDDALLGLADSHYYRGRLAEAGATLARALQRAQARDDDDAVALGLWSSAYVALWAGDLDSAREQLLRQQVVAKKAGLKVLAALGRNALGDVERLAGRAVDAAAHYEEAARQLRQAGSGKLRVVELNAALCALNVDVDDAVARAERLLPEVERAGERVLSALCHGILAVGTALEGDWSAVDAHLAAFSQPHVEGLIDGEIGLLAERVAQVAVAAGQTQRASLALSWARGVWQALGRSDRLEKLPAV
ncbi:MAG: protein kinase [Deltaproteobacteria bacterium]|nr:protein kinase [Deltaproteobacteria bacterium]